MKYIFLIPARSGSKRLVNKNLKIVGGMTLIERSVRFARSLGFENSEIYLSSDSVEYLRIGEKFGAKAHHRDVSAATDNSLAKDVVKDFLSKNTYQDSNKTVIIYLQPSSPFRYKSDFYKMLELFEQEKTPVFSVKKIESHPEKMLVLNEKSIANKFSQTSNPTQNYQNLQSICIADGSIYIFTVAQFTEYDDVPVLGALAFENSAPHVDIDSQYDIDYANYLVERKIVENF